MLALANRECIFIPVQRSAKFSQVNTNVDGLLPTSKRKRCHKSRHRELREYNRPVTGPSSTAGDVT